MDTDIQTPVEPIAPPVDPVVAPVPDESLAAHEASYSPNRVEEPATDEESTTQKPALTRHRAKKDQAGPEDVPRIRELTKANAELKAQLEALQKQRPEPQRTEAPRAVPTPTPQPSAPSAFTEVEPVLDSFSDEPDPYAAWLRALLAYNRRKERFEEQQARAVETAKADDARQQAEWTQAHTTFKERATAFAQTHPDYDTLIAAQGENVFLPPLAYQSLLRDDNGPAFVYHLLTHPDQLAEMHLLFDGKPVNDQTVALATRWLSSRLQPVASGAGAPTPPVVMGSRPPTPLRTGPLKTGDDVPGDDSSLADHEKAYGPKRRR